jgi:hypothetical protein
VKTKRDSRSRFFSSVGPANDVEIASIFRRKRRLRRGPAARDTAQVATDPDWAAVRGRLRSAVLRDAVVLVVLYGARPVHRFRPWYWRVTLAATLAGVAIGLGGLYRDLHRPDGVVRRCAA